MLQIKVEVEKSQERSAEKLIRIFKLLLLIFAYLLVEINIINRGSLGKIDI